MLRTNDTLDIKMASKYTEIERLLIGIGKILSIPFAPFRFTTVKPNQVAVIYRLGRVETVKEPGLRYVPLFPFPDQAPRVFVGAQTMKTQELHINDSTGTPIRVAALFNYHIDNPAQYSLSLKAEHVLKDRAELVVRETCRKVPMIAEDGHDLRNGTKQISEELMQALQSQTTDLGIKIDSAQLAEVNYAPEIAQQMLMKQQAQATVAARKEIVEGLVSVVKGTVNNFDYLTADEKSRLTTNLLTTLASHAPPQPVIQLK